MYKFYRIIAVSIALLLTSCASNEEKDPTQGSTEQELYQKAVKQISLKQWHLAVETLQILEEYFPFGVFSEQSQLDLIYTYYKVEDYDLVLATADRFIRLNPQHANVDYAYYMRGVANFNQETSFRTAFVTDTSNRDTGSAKLAFEQFGELLTKFPNTLYGPDARKRMEHLRNTLARYDIHVANYYFKRGSYIAAARRGKEVVENMPGTPAVPDGLAVMAQAYHLMGMDELANNATKVLAINYPNYPYLNEDGSFKYQKSITNEKSLIDYITLGLFSKNQYIKFDTRAIYNPVYTQKDTPIDQLLDASPAK